MIHPKFFEDINELLKYVTLIKNDSKTIGFTNGCFDLLHEGHIFLISESKKYCDFLIVAINSDESIKILKGKERPIDNVYNRILKLSKNSDVDVITVFKDQTPIKLIKAIMPDILIKGYDYKNKNIVGADYVVKSGGTIKLIDLVPNISTTSLIKKNK